jgi:hypothetical protein
MAVRAVQGAGLHGADGGGGVDEPGAGQDRLPLLQAGEDPAHHGPGLHHHAVAIPAQVSVLEKFIYCSFW